MGSWNLSFDVMLRAKADTVGVPLRPRPPERLVLVTLVALREGPQGAIQLVLVAPFDFDLNRRVPDAEVVPEHPGHGLEDLLAAPDALLGDEDVAGRNVYPRGDGPDVQVMDPEDPVNALD